MIRPQWHPSARSTLVLGAGFALWLASANGFLPAGPQDRAELLLAPIFALVFAAVSAFLHHDARRWPLEAAFFGAAAAWLGPIWAGSLALSCVFVRWCVAGRWNRKSGLAWELAAVGAAGALAAFLQPPYSALVFSAVWLLVRRTPATTSATLFGIGIVGYGLAEAASPVWLSLAVLPVILASFVASEEAACIRNANYALQTLGVMLQRAHPFTHAHIARVARIAERTARRLGLSEERAELVQRAARLHDVGKIAIDEAILDKPGHLTPEEYAHVKLHAPYGAAILEEVGDVRAIARWIRCHHERPDGLGYPQGLKGNQIPIEARIIAAADAFDAMTGGFLEGEKRPYRDPLSPSEAIAELERCAGTQFDPRVVAAFRHALEQEGAI